MEKKLDEFVNSDGTLISSKIPNIDPLTTAKTTTDKSIRMRAQPFMYTVYRRFFSEGEELLHTKKADQMKDDPKKFHEYLKTIGEGDSFEKYFQKPVTPKDKLKEISRIKAYEVMETLINRRANNNDIVTKTLPTIDEIKNKEILLVDKLTKLAETIRDIMTEDEKKVISSYFNEKIR